MTLPAVSTACSGIVCRMAVIGQRLDVGHDKEFMSTLAKGLAVLGAFGKERPSMTLSDAANVADLSRATARRVLRTDLRTPLASVIPAALWREHVRGWGGSQDRPHNKNS